MIRDQLIAARKLIEQPEHWTQGTYARDKNGKRVPPKSPEAVCWCAFGAILTQDISYEEEMGIKTELNKAARKLGQRLFFSLNDNTDHETVLKMFDLSIEGIA